MSPVFLATVVESYVLMTSKTRGELIQLWGEEQPPMNMDGQFKS